MHEQFHKLGIRPLALARQTVAIVLAGGRGSRLLDLTDERSKPAVFFGGKFRIIDFTLSNCVNSGIRRMAVLTQYKSHSLLRHLQRGWNIFKSELNEFLDLLPAQQRIDETMWYRGTADAVFQNIDILRSYRPKYILVLAGDHIYKMDYSLMLADHVLSGASCTVGCIEVPRKEASALGVMSVDEQRRITSFVEKPADPPGMPDRPDMALASMGIYVFDADYLFNALRRDHVEPASAHDFGRDIVPRAVAEGAVLAHPFSFSCVKRIADMPTYWRDVGTIDAYWEANIDLTATTPELDMYDTGWPTWTFQEQLPPAKFVHDVADRRGVAVQSLVSGGCIISGSLHRSLLFSKCRVHSWTVLDGAVLLPEVEVGRRARLTNVVIDRGVKIPEGMVIGQDPGEDARRFHRTVKGITLVTTPMLARL